MHSPPKGYVDGDRHLGSKATLHAIEDKQSRLTVCGHIHEAAGDEAWVGSTRVLNAGPAGTSSTSESDAARHASVRARPG